MVDLPSSAAISMENERSLKSLLRAMTLARGRFSLILAHCNYSNLRSQMMQQLHQQETLQVREIVLSKAAQTLFTAIKTELGDAIPQALVISGLEAVENLDTLLLATNQVRDEFSKSLACPFVLWVTNEVLTQLVRLAPDFYSWAASPISFQLSSSELGSFLRQQADRAFAESLDPHHPLPIDDLFRYQLPALPRRHEVEAALRDLQTQSSALQPDLIASLQFIFGQADYAEDNVEQAIEKYNDSLTFWQQANDLARQGAALLSLGLCSLRWSEIDAACRASHLEAARTYFQDCLAAFESTNRRDLKAKFIGYQGEALKRLNAWAELQTLVQEAQDLHHAYPSPVEQAKANGLLAEIALWHLQDYLAASHHAQAALQSLESAAISPPPSQAKYWVLLAEAQCHLKQPHEAMRSLEQAQNQISSQDNPHLYIHILERLRALYFEQKQYEKAFQFKREQLSIESQYGLRAFIGAGRLQPHRQLRSSAPNTDTIAQEIAVSGRQQDVNRLLERVSRDDCKLTILHGQLGVGKSSLIQAGLIPTLEPEPIKARDVVVVLLRSYSNWVDKLGEKLGEQTQKRKDIPITIPHSPATLLQQLSNNDDRNFLSVLILDQFEEFFFSCPQPRERQAFFKFLSACLEIPFIKIILSLREDYLHYLLEWEHYDDLKPINGNILSKDHRYELRNFSSEDTRRIIQGLTNRSHLTLEEALVNQLVQDLTGETGEVRPIELQVVGAQLHEEKIRTFEQYRLLGDRPKETLVQNYLEGVIRDCGAENENAARLVLYLLTGENNTRPSKTRDELETDLKALEKDLLKEAQKLDLVLEIFRQSGLVFLLPETPADRYQLVHDYLVAFIRKQQPKIDELVRDLERQREQLKATEEKLKISELEREISDDKQRLIQTELALSNQEKRNKEIALAATGFALGTVILGSILMLVNYRYFMGYELNSKFDLYQKFAQNLVDRGQTEAALIENLKGVDFAERELLLKGYSIEPDLMESSINSLEKVTSKLTKESSITKEKRNSFFEQIRKAQTDEQLQKMSLFGCQYTTNDLIKKYNYNPEELCKRK